MGQSAAKLLRNKMKVQRLDRKIVHSSEWKWVGSLGIKI